MRNEELGKTKSEEMFGNGAFPPDDVSSVVYFSIPFLNSNIARQSIMG